MRIVGISIVVIIRVLSIIGGLSFLESHSHEFV